LENKNLILIVDEDSIGQRLDKWLVGKIENSSRSKIQANLKKGLVSIDQKIMKANYILKLSDEVHVEILEESPAGPQPEDIPLEIIFEDDFILVINKPAGMMVHENNHNEKGTLVNALLFYACSLATAAEKERPGIVHRLDKNTSGIMLVAKTDEAYFKLVDDFKNRKIEKEYRALVVGKVSQKNGEIDANIVRVGAQSKMKVIDFGGKESFTRYEVAEEFKEVSYMKVYPKTGRTHQIRVHMNSIGNPILCDDLYGHDFKEYCVPSKNNAENIKKRVLLKRHALHAYAIKFDHPINGEKMDFVADLALDFKSVLMSLREGEKRIK